MAVVPDDEIGTVQQEPLAGRAIPHFDTATSPADFGYGLGEGLEHAASDLNQVQQRQNAAAKQAQEKANQDADRVKAAQTIQQWNQWKVESLYGKDATDPKAPPDPNAVYRQSGDALATLPERATSAYQDKITASLQGLPPHLQGMLGEHAANMVDSVSLEAHRYAFEQFNREKVETFNNTASQETAIAGLDFRDPANYGNHKDAILLAGQSLAEIGGKDSLKAYNDGGYRRDLDKLNESVINGHLAAGDIRGAQRALDAHKDDLSSGVVHEQLQNQIRAAGDRLDALQRDASRDRIQDQLAAAKAGLPGWEKIASPGDYQVVHKNDWQRQYEATQKWAAAGAAEKHFDQMSAADVADMANGKGKPTTAYPGVSQDLEINQTMQAAAVRSLKKWRDDPADAIIQNGRWQQIDWSKPKDAMDQLAMRANTAPGIAQERGQPVQLQSKQEAAQLANTLGGMAPQKQVAFLAQLHDNSGDGERGYFSVLRQIAPSNPVAAIAGQRIARPDDWSEPSWYDPQYGAKPEQAQAILAGNALLHPAKGTEGAQAKGFPMPEERGTVGLRSFFARQAGNLFADRGELGEAHYQAFRAAYAGYASQAGDMSGKYDVKYAKPAFEAAVGKIATVNGNPVVPPNGMNPDRMEDIVHRTVEAAAKSMGAGADWADRLKGYHLEEDGPVGSGRYRLLAGNALIARPDGKTDAAGNPLPMMIDLTR